MRVFLVGATGAIGRRLVPQLIAAGHEVAGTTTRAAKEASLRELGAEPVVLDVLDRGATIDAVRRAEPDAVVHQATALSGTLDMRKFAESFAHTNRLRTEGTDNLLEAARAAGVERIVAQSFAAWPAARIGGPIKTEDDPVDRDPPPAIRPTLTAILQLEREVTAAGGLALRYGGFYGPDTSLAPGGEHLEAIRKRRFPVVGNGAGIWSFVHVDDAAAATVAALERGEPGVYNVVDDEPAPVAEWLPFLAELIGRRRHGTSRGGSAGWSRASTGS